MCSKVKITKGQDYQWYKPPPPATEQDIAALAVFVGRPLPADYVAFLRRHDGGALRYRDLWYVHLWRASDIPTWSAAYNLTPSRVPGAFAIGSEGGSEGLVLDARPEREDGVYPVYAIGFIDLDWHDAWKIAPDFRSFMLRRSELLSA